MRIAIALVGSASGWVVCSPVTVISCMHRPCRARQLIFTWEKLMTAIRKLVVLTALCVCFAPLLAQDLYVYPRDGQNQEQQEADDTLRRGPRHVNREPQVQDACQPEDGRQKCLHSRHQLSDPDEVMSASHGIGPCYTARPVPAETCAAFPRPGAAQHHTFSVLPLGQRCLHTPSVVSDMSMSTTALRLSSWLLPAARSSS